MPQTSADILQTQPSNFQVPKLLKGPNFAYIQEGFGIQFIRFQHGALLA
jgi:hypothetical protein